MLAYFRNTIIWAKNHALSTKPIALWSGPRNVSTALMYYFAYRGDTRVWDEPLFGHFLKQTGVWRPSRDEVLLNMETNAERVLKDLDTAEGKPYKFYKNMANHLEGLNYNLTKGYKNVILCRQPEAVISSYTKQVKQPTELDLCYRHQVQLLEYFTGHGISYFVLDSDELRKDASGQLSKLSAYLDIPFSKDMLSWEAGPLPEDGIWAKYWYHNVHRSSGFAPYETKEFQIPSEMEALLESSQKLYQQILSYKHE